MERIFLKRASLKWADSGLACLSLEVSRAFNNECIAKVGLDWTWLNPAHKFDQDLQVEIKKQKSRRSNVACPSNQLRVAFCGRWKRVSRDTSIKRIWTERLPAMPTASCYWHVLWQPARQRDILVMQPLSVQLLYILLQPSHQTHPITIVSLFHFSLPPGSYTRKGKEIAPSQPSGPPSGREKNRKTHAVQRK